ncbi:carboxylating nicotinate-nucleotide diphosphorylase, partial [Empedobacter brevis]|uniref:carboxylating nicotinate-nucleotide diphosphorylase n=1 Tax=Empedobacter brevis TaxID=247 RepID=UPI002FDFED91
MNFPPYITQEKLQLFIRQAFLEDVGDGDHSTLACVPYDSVQEAELKVKDNGIIAGIELAKIIFATFDPSLRIETFKMDGDKVQFGDTAFKVKGSSQSILTCERLVLNCMQRMSGIATYANEMMELVKGTNAKILDTRKTTPNFRMIEKWAVKIGGAENHRFGLYDMVMLKDNHVDFSGNITKAVAQTKDYLTKHHLNLKIEVETRNMNEVKEALEANVDFIMLDNFDLETMKDAVQYIGGRTKTEASGGVTKQSVREI